MLFILLGLLAITSGLLWLILSPRDPEKLKVFNATASRDCAPWDGAAFTVSIPYDSVSVIEISVWQSPNIKLPVTFTFNDQMGKIGSAVYQPRYGAPVWLSGSVFFPYVQDGVPFTGVFHLKTESGVPFQGKIKAVWENHLVMCG
jgi:hypothetical protein